MISYSGNHFRIAKHIAKNSRKSGLLAVRTRDFQSWHGLGITQHTSPRGGQHCIVGEIGMNILKGAFAFSLVLVSVACTTQSNRPALQPAKQLRLPELTTVGMTESERLIEIERIKSEPAEPFKLGRGDILYISVYDEPDLTVDGLPIRPDGMISFPLIGDLEAEQKTVEAVRLDLTDQLGYFLVDPKVTVVVKKYVSQRYTIIGQIVKPGTFSLDTETRLTQALARSGGLTQGQFHASSIELADLSHAFISRDGKMLPVDFVALFHAGDLRYDLPLKSGDYIYIPSGLSREVYVLGEVRRPDMFAFREGLPLSKALVIAEGFTREADLSRVHVVRGSLTNPALYIVNMKEVFAGRALDISLQPGDVVFVPATGLSKWSDIINKILPSMLLARTGNTI